MRPGLSRTELGKRLKFTRPAAGPALRGAEGFARAVLFAHKDLRDIQEALEDGADSGT